MLQWLLSSLAARSLGVDIGWRVGQVEVVIDVVSHLVRDVDRWVQCVKLNVEFIQIELLSFVLNLLDRVAVFIL